MARIMKFSISRALDDLPTEIVNVVGPICESGDQLGIERLLPPTQEGDVLSDRNGRCLWPCDELDVQPARAGDRNS